MEKDLRFLGFWYCSNSVLSGEYIDRGDLTKLINRVSKLVDEEENNLNTERNIIDKNKLIRLICDLRYQNNVNNGEYERNAECRNRLNEFIDDPEGLLKVESCENGERIGDYAKWAA